MKLLLTSAGLPNEGIRSKFLQMIGKDPKDIVVAFIPTAADPEEDKWFVKSAMDEIKEIGMQLFTVDLKDENEQSLMEKLAGSDVVYVNGGNTFYLLDWARKSGFDKVIKDLVIQGKVYIGTSAGSLLVGPDISVSGWKSSWDRNIVGLKDFSGLGLVPFVVSPHFAESEREVLEKNMKEVNYQIIALTDKQAIAVEDDHKQLVGEGNEIILNETNNI